RPRQVQRLWLPKEALSQYPKRTVLKQGNWALLSGDFSAFGLSFSFIRPTRSQLLVYETAHASGTRFVGGATQDSCCFSGRELAVETMLTRRRRGLPTLHQLGCAGRASDERW